MSKTALTKRLRLLLIATLLITLALSLRLPPTARAATITVNSTADTVANDGQCTLREAIIAANADTASGSAASECAAGVGDDTIDLTGVNGTINLTGPLPGITTNIVFNGPGESNLTVQRDTGGEYRIFTVGSGAIVTISGLTISNGSVVDDFGGGIYNAGTLTLSDSTVSDNSTNTTITGNGHGGGIYNAGTLTLNNSIVSSNSVTNSAGADSYGGGIYDAGTLTLNNSTVRDNNTYGDHCHGGGIHNQGTLTLNNSTVSDNSAGTTGPNGDGGGIHNVGSDGSATLNNSTVSNNSSNNNGSGGGIWNSDDAIMVLNNSTVSGNSSDHNSGGIDNSSNSTLVLNNSTISNNNAGGSGGAIRNGSNSTVNFRNSIIAGNAASSVGPDCYNLATFTSGDYNLVGNDSDCPFTPQSNDQVNVDPLLGPLQLDPPGNTETHALLTGSPAIDAIPEESCTDHQGRPITTDQRGIPRPQGATAACDIGAYEVAQNTDLSLSKTVDEASPDVGDTIIFTIQVTNNGSLGATGVVISDSLPPGLTCSSSSTDQGSYTSSMGEWNMGSLAVGLSATLTITATVDAGAAGTTITNTATIAASDQFDPNANNTAMVAITVLGLEPSEHYLYLPLVMRNYTPLAIFPLHIGDAIPARAVVYQGEIFYIKSAQMPDELPSGGHFYFSSQRDTVAEVIVDDELAVLLDGTEVFTYDFSTSGIAEPAILEVPRTTMAQLAGQTVTIEYRDVYGWVVQASTMWLIWSP